MVCIKFSRGRHPRGDGKLDARKKIRWKKPVKNALITSIVLHNSVNHCATDPQGNDS